MATIWTPDAADRDAYLSRLSSETPTANPEQIPILFQAAQDAYRARWRFDDPGFDLSTEWQANVKTIVVGHEAAIVIDGLDWVVVGVAGSDDISDWWSNLDARRCPRGPLGLSVHEGFADGYLALREAVDDALLEAIGTSVRQEGRWGNAYVHFCGHSRGGAIAQLLAVDSFAARSALTQCVTFGSPRVFAAGSRLPDGMERRIWRVENSNDIVTHAPTAWRFRHRGARVLLDEAGGMLVRPPLWKLVWSKLKSYRGDALQDHLQTSYHHSIQAVFSPPSGI